MGHFQLSLLIHVGNNMTKINWETEQARERKDFLCKNILKFLTPFQIKKIFYILLSILMWNKDFETQWTYANIKIKIR